VVSDKGRSGNMPIARASLACFRQLKTNRGIGTASMMTLQPPNPFVDKVKGSTQLTGFRHARPRVPFLSWRANR